jgi:polysaccharide biosynthesis protein PslG
MGINSSATWSAPGSNPLQESLYDYYAGAQWVRMVVNWNELEPSRPGQVNPPTLARYDYAVELAGYLGLKVEMPISDGVPYWASSDPGKHIDSLGVRRWDPTFPPIHMSDYRRVVQLVASHFAPLGVTSFEIWNEPNLKRFWKPHPSPVRYTRMLRAGYRGVKAADPAAQVVLGGLAKNDYRFLARIYRAGGGRYFDVASDHPYTRGSPLKVRRDDRGRISRNSFPGFREVRRTMVRHGDAAKPLTIGEFGYSTNLQNGGVSEERQARYLIQAFAYADRYPWINTMFWYDGRDFASGPLSRFQYGLVHANFSPKPSYHAYWTLAKR